MTIALSLIASIEMNSQIINLPCQQETDGTIGLDRNNWNGGSTTNHSEGIMHNFTLPSNTFGPCKIITNIEITVTPITPPVINLPTGCVFFDFFLNFSDNCPSFAPASCNDIFNQVQGPFVTQTINFSSPPQDFTFGETFGVDVIPAMLTPACTDGQSMITAGHIILDYEICVTVTVSDDVISPLPNLGPDETICPSATTPLNAGPFSGFMWDPNGETSQTINASPGVYTVTVTDANGCTATDDITVFAHPVSPITFNPSMPTVCDNGNINVSIIESYSNYSWSTGMSGQTQSLSTGIYQVTITDGNNCTSTDEIEIANVPSPNPGMDNNIDVCNDGTTYDIEALLGSHDSGGLWTDNNGSGVNINTNPSAVSFNGVIPGIYTFTYEVPGTAPCGPEQATITVEVYAVADAGQSTTEEFCLDPGFVDFYALLGNPDLGGVWTDVSGSGVNLADPFSVNLNGLAPNTYTFNYEVGQGGPCNAQTSTLTIDIVEGVDAGFDAQATVCDGVQVDLWDLVTTNNFSGQFLDTDGSGALNGSIVNTTGLAGLTFNFTYVVGTQGSICGTDEAILTITIESGLTAGIGNTGTYCLGEIIDLYDLLSGENTGGIFVDLNNTGGLLNNILNTENLVPGIYNYRYIVGDGLTCPEDSAEIQVEILQDPSYSILSDTFYLCENSCDSIEIILSGTPPFNLDLELFSIDSNKVVYTSNIQANSNNLVLQSCNLIDSILIKSDSIFLKNDGLFQIIIPNLSDAQCNSRQNLISDSIFLQTVQVNRFELDTTICISDTLMLGDESFYFGKSVLIDTLPGRYCDSLVNITVRFSQADTVRQNPTICRGDSIQILGIWFSENNTRQEINLPGQRGCDSLVIVEVDFYQIDNDTIDLQLCDGEEITVNGTLYNATNPMGIEILRGGSATGCDSTVYIDLEFTNLVQLSITDTLCRGDSLIIGTTVFNEQNSTGSVLLDNSGCDTTIMVALTFRSAANGTVDGLFCPDYSIEINGNIYDINNPVGTENISSGSAEGCDSIVLINLSFRAPISENYTESLCRVEKIIINGTEYNENNPTGTETFTSSFGCDSLVQINLIFNDNFNVPTAVTICEGDSLFVGGDWQKATGIFIDTFSTVNLCDSIVTTTLTVEPCGFDVSVSSLDVVCFGDTTGSIILELPSFSQPIIIFLENTSTQESEAFQITPTSTFQIDGLASGQYLVVIRDLQGAILWQSSVEIMDLNTALSTTWVIADSINCNGGLGSLNIIPNGGQSPYSYEWNDIQIGDSSSAIDILAGAYTVTITDSNNCVFESSFTLNEPSALSAEITVTQTSCQQANDGAIEVVTTSGGANPYEIFLNGNLSPTNQISSLGVGQYTLEIVDANNCKLTFNEVITSDQDPILAEYPMSYVVELGDSINISGTLFSDDLIFDWSGDVEFSCVDCPDPIVFAYESTQIQLMVTNSDGCQQSINIDIEVEENFVRTTYPNIFSPNKDGINDDFVIINNDPTVTSMNLKIYDRWGNLMVSLETSENLISWNGLVNGTVVVPGVYIYYHQLNYNDGRSKVRTGDVLVIK